jgi:hypothetical protein
VFVFVFEALDIQRELPVRHIFTRALFKSTTFSHIIS